MRPVPTAIGTRPRAQAARVGEPARAPQPCVHVTGDGAESEWWRRSAASSTSGRSGRGAVPISKRATSAAIGTPCRQTWRRFAANITTPGRFPA